jgi:hypothetical protein
MDRKTLALLELGLLACIGVGLAFAWDKPIFIGIFAAQAALAFWQAVHLSMHK